MARNHGKIETGFWQNAKVRGLSEDARTLLLYLYSAPHSTAAGAYVLPGPYACHDLNWSSERVAEGFLALSIKPFALWDSITGVVMIVGWHEHNKAENPNVAGHIARLLLALPDCPLKARAIDEFKIGCGYRKEVEKVLGAWVYEPSDQQLPLRFPEGSRPSLTEPSLTEPSLTEPNRKPTASSRKSDAPAAPRGTRLPDGWQPSDDAVAWGIKAGFSDPQVRHVAEAFADHWRAQAGAKGVKLDWDATFRNWLRREDPAKIRLANGKNHAPTDASGQWRARLMAWENGGRAYWPEQAYGCGPPPSRDFFQACPPAVAAEFNLKPAP